MCIFMQTMAGQNKNSCMHMSLSVDIAVLAVVFYF